MFQISVLSKAAQLPLRVGKATLHKDNNTNNNAKSTEINAHSIKDKVLNIEFNLSTPILVLFQ